MTAQTLLIEYGSITTSLSVAPDNTAEITLRLRHWFLNPSDQSDERDRDTLFVHIKPILAEARAYTDDPKTWEAERRKKFEGALVEMAKR